MTDNHNGTEAKLSIQKKITIVNNKGLHARASSKFVALVNKLPKDLNIFVIKNDQKAVGNSIMGLMMLGAARGNDIDVIIEYNPIDKDHAEHALNRLEGLLLDGFGED